MALKASPLGTGPLKITALSYTAGDVTSYRGLTVISTSGNIGYPVNQLFYKGKASPSTAYTEFADDLTLAEYACRRAFATGSTNSGSGIQHDKSVDAVIVDYVAHYQS